MKGRTNPYTRYPTKRNGAATGRDLFPEGSPEGRPGEDDDEGLDERDAGSQRSS